MNPTGLLALDQTIAQTNIVAQNTNYLCRSIAPFSVEQGRNYCIHVSGIIGFTNNASNTSAQTATGVKASIIANSANGSTTTVTTGSTVLQSQYVDPPAWSSGVSQGCFDFEIPWSSGNNTQLSVGWMVNIPTFNANNSSYYAKSNMIYVEQH